ncbi:MULTISPECIES: DEAD/DEAH box helicase family protein [unclassified Pseudoalteromonas]|uniref:type I restriction endonuclease subunit R n=1 Tax=unclassified Pseudoalteromonas TaxID=194690 RepID=UPI0023584765|nr:MULTISPECIES: DEAD/DEAH box helicase family protein [unclassified Pseudoalteromonas]MDC9500693.1 DEAD/DEAH box helicase family protein [Pseudoalteromonas sp. Angola-18]MDC9529304.1 DEAD/DEAH box helicase family protein [Pseudoalteromonas sp. Angola-7]
MKQSMNFEHIQSKWPELHQLAAFAEDYAITDPQSSLVKLRCFAEKVVGYLYKELSLPVLPTSNIFDKLTADDFTSAVPRLITDKLHAIRKSGNQAAHEGKVDQQQAIWILKESYFVASYLFMAYANGTQQECPEFKAPEQTQPTNQSDAEFAKKNKQLTQQLAENQARLKRALDELEAAELAQKQAQQQAAKLKQTIDAEKLAQVKTRNEQIVNSSFNFNEDETRKRIIDLDLRNAGWHVALDDESTEDVGKEVKVTDQPTTTGVGYVDYVLWDDDGKPLAVIEAKRTRENIEKGRQQATLYANALEKQYGQRPVIFYSNGWDIKILDDTQGYNSRGLYGYYSKGSLQYLIKQRTLKKDLNKTPIDTAVAGRLYQMETITRVCERFSDKHRKALIVQATGTGKTRVSIALAKRLLDAGWAKRVLFLCDRKELRKQAGNAFTEFTKEPVHIVGKSAKNTAASARVFIATYPGMLRIMNKYDVGYFDLIVADESHRSIYNIYGDIFKYFDALEVGLTATPVEMVSRSTCDLFGCDYKLPTANYPLEDAIEQGNLVPYKIVSYTTQFLREGIKKDNLTDEQIAQLEEQGIDPNELDFDAKQIDEAIKNKDTNRLILRNLMEKGLRDKDGQLPGKTIIFARNIAHAELMAQLFSELYPQHGANFCRVIHSKYERAEELIDDFKSSDENSMRIAVSVDMLDTGIDVPECVNLVFAKPIKSKVKFWQMIGRGTRLCENLYGPGQHKTHFLIFDHWANFEYFDENPEEDDVKQAKSLLQKLFEARVILAQTALKKANIDVFDQTIKLIHDDICLLPMESISVRDNWQVVETFKDLKRLNQFIPDDVQKLLEEVAPLMQWRNIMGQSEAYKFDLELTTIQTLIFTDANQIDLAKQSIMNKVESLQMHLNEVRSKAPAIAEIQTQQYWQYLTHAALEQSRINLRSIIHLRNKSVKPPTSDFVLDIKEDENQIHEADRLTKIVSIDYQIYRQEVEKTLTPLFETDSVLKKIRNGEQVTEADLAQLSSLVHTQNPSVDLNTLKEFFPESTASLDKILRTIVGMDKNAIEQSFTTFVQQIHTHVNAKQQRFIGMLKNHLIRHGAIEIAQLYDAPFTQIHDMGLDGVFSQQQADVIEQFIKQFDVQLGDKNQTVDKEVIV